MPKWASHSRAVAPWVGVAILLVGVPGAYLLGGIDIVSVNMLGRFLCLSIMAMGLDLVWGYTGILSLCQAMFFVFGGYAIGMHLALHGPLDGDGIPRCLFVVTSVVSGFKLPWFWEPFRNLGVAVFLAHLLPAVAAFLFGFFAFRSRVRGVYFSIISQALVVAAVLVFRRNETRLCGTNGLTNFVTLAGFDLTKPSVKLGLYLLTVVSLIVTYAICRYVVCSRLGRLLIAVRDNETRLRFTGYDPVVLKTFVFTLGALMAAVGGMLYTPQNGIITPFKMEPIESILVVVWVAVGGRGTLIGAVVGALIVNYLYSFLTSHWPASWPFVLGGVFILAVLFLPDGLVGAWNKWMERLSRRGPHSPPQETGAAHDAAALTTAAAPAPGGAES